MKWLLHLDGKLREMSARSGYMTVVVDVSKDGDLLVHTLGRVDGTDVGWERVMVTNELRIEVQPSNAIGPKGPRD